MLERGGAYNIGNYDGIWTLNIGNANTFTRGDVGFIQHANPVPMLLERGGGYWNDTDVGLLSFRILRDVSNTDKYLGFILCNFYANVEAWRKSW